MLRVYVRAAMLKVMGVDDYLSIGAMACSVGVLICFVGETKLGVGRRSRDISTQALSKIDHWMFFHSLMVTIGISLVKISIAFFLLRLVQAKAYKRFLVGMIVFLTLFCLSCAGTLIFACIPVSAQWNFAQKATAKCFSINTFTAIGLYNSTVNIITDVLFAVLPVPMVWNLQVNKRTKVTLTLILGLGFFACAASIVKTVLQSKVLSTPDPFRNDSYYIWNDIELNVGILAASLPTLRPLFSSLIDSTKAFITSGGRTGMKSGAGTRGTKHRDTAKYYAQQNSIGLNSLPSGADQFRGNEFRGDKYRGKDFSKGQNIVTVTAGRSDNDSEEGILPPHDAGLERISVKKEYGVAWEAV